jgi:signal transduction histidine kinase/HAMP domain-containing protein
MRAKLIYSLLSLFALFLAGSGITMLYLYKTTSNMESVINLHKVEIIRQDLVISAQTVQSHLYTFGTAFGQELDIIVDNVLDLDMSTKKCLGCHHSKEITDKLNEVVSLVEQYQDALSYLITSTANPERIERFKMISIGTGSKLLEKVQEMAFIAGQKLNEKSIRSLRELNNSRVILIVTLILSFFIAVAIAVTMTRQITEPIDELVDATRHIKTGELGYTTHYKGQDEFGELINSFNDMSISLAESNKKIMHHLHSLSNLYSVTLTFHAVTNKSDIYRELAFGVSELVGSEHCGLMLLEGDNMVLQQPAIGFNTNSGPIRIPKDEVMKLYMPSNRRAFIFNGKTDPPPFTDMEWDIRVKNMMLVWLRQKGELAGIITVINKRSGEFSEEDVHPLAILANNVSVALENARLYDDLRRQMQELQDAQDQLVQATKLVAIGELASNVAHEINNPLTSILGYAELIKEEKDPSSILKDIDVIEKESLRAREIVHQLLEFSRKRSLNIIEVDLNKVIKEVIELVSLRIKESSIEIVEEYGNITTIEGDENQIKQVFLNVINNAVYAMGQEGTLGVSTYTKDTHVYAIISDTGVGVPKELQSRIFEPFFSTKKDKGTGIGLSISYTIIQGHNGHIELQSEEGKGSKFTVMLPLKRPVEDLKDKEPKKQI